MERDGTIRLTSARPSGTGIHTHMALVLDSTGQTTRAGASDLATDTVITLCTIRGGVRWPTTDAVGIHTTVGARGAGRLRPMYMVGGETPRIRGLQRHGQILTRAAMAPRAEAPLTIPKLEGLLLAAGDTTAMFTPVMRSDIEAEPSTTPTVESSPAQEERLPATGTPGKAAREKVAS